MEKAHTWTAQEAQMIPAFFCHSHNTAAASNSGNNDMDVVHFTLDMPPFVKFSKFTVTVLFAATVLPGGRTKAPKTTTILAIFQRTMYSKSRCHHKIFSEL